MKRSMKKMIAAVMTFTMVTGCLQNNLMSVQAAETSGIDVNFCYDDGVVDTEGFFFMKEGKFNEELDENAILVLQDKDGNKIEIPNQKPDGSKAFTKAAVSISGGTYNFNMVRLYNDAGIAFMKLDGSYFGGEEKYFDYDEIKLLNEHVMLAKDYGTYNDQGILIEKGNTYIITDTGKTIKFKEITNVETKSIDDTLVFYEKEADVGYAYNFHTDELLKLQGSIYVNGGYIFVSTENGNTSMYDSSLSCLNDSLPGTYSLTGYHTSGEKKCFRLLYNNKQTVNVVDSEGLIWADMENKMQKLEVIDVEQGYYCAFIQEENMCPLYLLSKDSSLRINITEEISKMDERDNINGVNSVSICERNGDLIVAVKETGNLYVFDQASGYSRITKLDTADYVNVSNGYLLTGIYDENYTINLNNLYDEQYKKITIQQPEVKYSYIRAVEGNKKWLFEGYDVEQNAYRMIAEDGSVSNGCDYSNIDFSGRYLSFGNSVYNQEGDLIYSSEDKIYLTGESYAPKTYLDGSIVVIKNSYKLTEESDFLVMAEDRQAYFSSKDCKMQDYTMNPEGTFLACVYQMDPEGNKKYGDLTKGTIKELVSDNQISVEYETGKIPQGAALYSKILSSEDETYQAISIDADFFAYEIKLLDRMGQEIQPTGKVKVSLPCPEDYQGEKCKVYHVLENGKMENMKAVYKEGYLSFETTHFSTYFITETDLKESILGDANSDGDVNSKDAVLLKKYLAGFENLNIALEAADFNQDGEVDSKDAVRMLRFLAGFEIVEVKTREAVYFSAMPLVMSGKSLEHNQISVVEADNIVQVSSKKTSSYGHISNDPIKTGDKEQDRIFILFGLCSISMGIILVIGKKIYNNKSGKSITLEERK